MKILKTPPQGMREFTADQKAIRNYIQNVILEHYQVFGFNQIETPCVENIALLSSGQGGENEKLIFKILKRGEKLAKSTMDDLADLGLRFDLTVPLARFYANNMGQLPKVNKFIQIGNVWRAERPQKGRYRQFTQCDIDVIGDPTYLAELELISATTSTLKQFGLESFEVKINDRRLLMAIANYCGFDEDEAGEVFIILDKLDKIGLKGITQEFAASDLDQVKLDKFLRVVTSFLEHSFEEFIEANAQQNIVPEEIMNDLKFVIDTVKADSGADLDVGFDLSLVRGMGYYTGMIFEVKVKGYSWSIAGGGRYDKMIGRFLGGKQQVPACGFSIGFERLALILDEQGFEIPDTRKRIALLGAKDPESIKMMRAHASKLREEGNAVVLDYKAKNMGKQLDDFKAAGYSAFAFVNPGEELELRDLS
ncbi:histidine--tRNA ligase [Gilvibacter sp.]|uniref:histidine--tRNA ligase n=1 Tax=Gilvibacter sp. TaxID=2729997 RepID=UPI0025C1FFE8|nr:histidine--tRNA ligase [Gilvibacter sp.]NQX77152.1 histidine--tRNA ligase [Gilvibacter sp.]